MVGSSTTNWVSVSKSNGVCLLGTSWHLRLTQVEVFKKSDDNGDFTQIYGAPSVDGAPQMRAMASNSKEQKLTT